MAKIEGTAPTNRIWAWINTKVFRRVVQFGVFAYILYVIIQHLIVGEGGTATSPEALCPYGGLETLYRVITANGAIISHTHLSNIVLIIATLAAALLVRNAFCGWICPLGFIQDLIYSLRDYLSKRFTGLRKFLWSLRKWGEKQVTLNRFLGYFKYLVLAWSLIGTAMYAEMIFRDYDPWAALINVAEIGFVPGTVVLIVVLVGSFFVSRPWCRYACPLGAVTGLVSKLSPTYIKRDIQACTSCKLCTRACPMALPVDKMDVVTSADCIGCLECVEACSKENALSTHIGLPLTAK